MRRAVAHAYDNVLANGTVSDPADLFLLANLGGARVLGIDDRTGSLEPGKDADFVVLSLPAWAHP